MTETKVPRTDGEAQAIWDAATPGERAEFGASAGAHATGPDKVTLFVNWKIGREIEQRAERLIALGIPLHSAGELARLPPELRARIHVDGKAIP